MTIKTLLLILILVESGGNDNAVGDNGRAYGPLQIHAVYVQDVNRIYGTSYRHEEMFDRQLAMEVASMYLSHYGSNERLGRNPTVADLALIHQGGPNGWKRDNETSKNYLAKVSKFAKETLLEHDNQ